VAASRSAPTGGSPKGGPHGDRDSVHFHISPLLLIGIVIAVISTVVVVISAIAANQPPGRPGQGQQPPPPPSTIPLMISLAFFVISWVTVAVAVARDQLATRIASAEAAREAAINDLRAWMAQSQADLTADRNAARQELAAQLAMISKEYGDERETQGYLDGMRAAAAGQAPSNGDVRTLRTVRQPSPDHDRDHDRDRDR
jgi:hypothetical protein